MKTPCTRLGQPLPKASWPAAAWHFCRHARTSRSSSWKVTGTLASGSSQHVLDWPCRLIAENAGQDGTVVVTHIRKSKEKNYGYNADTGEYEDLRKAGIVDPVKVTRSALQNGASVACLLLTTESLVADLPEKDKKMDPHDDHGMGGGMGGMGGGMGGMGGMGGGMGGMGGMGDMGM